MAVCGSCDQEMTEQVACTDPTYEENGRVLVRIPYPDRMPSPPEEYLANCPDCGTPKGGLHHPGCDVERCPNPGCIRIDGSLAQAISCYCGSDTEDDEDE